MPRANGNPRLIEVAFPLKQASLDSVHEKNVRHGHISTLHIWPARRPLAASRAALIATLLPDPGNDVERKRLLELLAGTVKTRNTFKAVGGRKVPVLREETEGGILHWGRENGSALDFFREEIKKAYGGRAPRVLDPFAGGGAIPLEAMRLGCEVTAIDINPVAWFILKCTLEYPQRLAGQTRPLPGFALDSKEFMASYGKARSKGLKGRAKKKEGTQVGMDGLNGEGPEDADLSWHVRAWGLWVLERARRDLERFYPTVDGKPTVAYLWARTVTCKNCRATIPLLKTLWLCKKDNKRWRLGIKPRADRTGVNFDVVEEPVKGGNAAQRRAHDQEAGRGTMSRSGAWCPVCGGPGTVAMTMEDIKAEAAARRMSEQLSARVVESSQERGYSAVGIDDAAAVQAANKVVSQMDETPMFRLLEPMPGKGRHRAVGSQLPDYGFRVWNDSFVPRQRLALWTFARLINDVAAEMQGCGYSADWIEAVAAYLSAAVDRVADRGSNICHWDVSRTSISGTFQGFKLQMTWDFAESNPIGDATGGWAGQIDWVALVADNLFKSLGRAKPPELRTEPFQQFQRTGEFDAIVTDPPYYDAIPYADLADFFYVWLKRSFGNILADAFKPTLTPKVDELVQRTKSGEEGRRGKEFYQQGMEQCFKLCFGALAPDGRLAVVFANKDPDAWETLVASLIRSGFAVDASWPIETEMSNRVVALAGAGLSTSIWLVCRKRPETARPGWDTQVLEEMRSRIYDRLRDFWDAGIRGPDFVWAATGPALEAYSKHPVVKKADEPNSLMTVSEFLRHVRRIVVDYVVGRILSQNGPGDASALDDVTLYYLLHRHDFGPAEAPVGASILYAQSCNLRDRDLADRFDVLAYGKTRAAAEVEEEDEEGGESDDEEAPTSGSTVKLKRWDQRRHKDLGLNVGGRAPPLIDQAHRIMHLWRDGDVQKVDAYLEDQGLRRNPIFPRLLQALIELAGKDNQPDERALLETIMNHVSARGAHPQMRMRIEEV